LETEDALCSEAPAPVSTVNLCDDLGQIATEMVFAVSFQTSSG